LSGNLPDKWEMPASTTKPKARAAKEERLEARVTAEFKRTVAHAAQLAGRSLTDFMLDSIRKSAHQTIAEHEVMRLTAEESREFVKTLLNPPGPNAKLRTLFASHRRQVRA
jgi:uncharacterized protein (DUF1778 family)